MSLIRTQFDQINQFINPKALEYKVGPYGLLFSWSEALWGARIDNCDIKPTDGATMFAYLRTGETSGID